MSSDPFSSGEPEYLGDAPSGSGGTGRPGRAARVGVAAAGVVGVVALGGWAALSLMSGGPQPDEAVPATALAYASIDLDPSAGQKLEAVRILEKFPALDEKLGLDASDDLRRWVFEESGLAECPGVDYEEDVEPWIGERAAVAVLPGAEAKDRPSPVLALQVTDGAAAADALGELLACEAAHGEHGGDDGGGPEDHEKQGGFAVGDGYVLLAESTAVAQAAVDAASAAPLAEDDAFARWTEAAGEPGIMTFYVAPDAPAGLAELQRSLRADEGWTTYGEPGELPGDMPGGPPFPVPGGVGPGMDPERVAALTVDFEGMAGVLRFADGAVEMELAGGGLAAGTAPADGGVSGVRELPETTGAAVSVALADGWAKELLESMRQAGGMPLDRMLAGAEEQTGLSLPEDLERLFGENVSLAVDSRLEVGPAIRGEDPSSLRLGVRVVGDPAEIMPVVDEVRAEMGPAMQRLVVSQGRGAVAFGFDHEYVARLAVGGVLDASRTFQSAVPERDRASAVVYVDFDAGDAWVERLVMDLAGLLAGRPADGSTVAEVRANLRPLEALGISTWAEDGVQRGLVRITTD